MARPIQMLVHKKYVEQASDVIGEIMRGVMSDYKVVTIELKNEIKGKLLIKILDVFPRASENRLQIEIVIDEILDSIIFIGNNSESNEQPMPLDSEIIEP